MTLKETYDHVLIGILIHWCLFFVVSRNSGEISGGEWLPIETDNGKQTTSSKHIVLGKIKFCWEIGLMTDPTDSGGPSD